MRSVFCVLATGVSLIGCTTGADPIETGLDDSDSEQGARPPTADAGPDRTVAPLSAVSLDASASTDPDGVVEHWQWAFTTRPVGSRAELSDPTAASPFFPADLAGDFALTLVVTDDEGHESAVADELVVHSSPSEQKFWVQISWPEAADIDLHLLKADASIFDADGDVNWCNENPDWGTPSEPKDDPSFLADSAVGPGVEAISIQMPASGETYTIAAHYFGGCTGGCGPVTVSAQVFIDGQPTWFATSVLTAQHDVWKAASYSLEGGVTAVGTSSSDSTSGCN